MEDVTHGLTTVMIIFLIFNTLTVGFRMFTRVHIKKAFGYDDVALCLAYAGYCIYCTLIFVAIYFGYGSTDATQPHYDRVLSTKVSVGIGLTYFPTAWLVKVSIALVVFRLSTDASKTIPRILLGATIVITVVVIVALVLLALQCQPILGYTWSTADILSNLIYTSLPAVLLWKLQMDWRAKAPVVAVFGLSLLSSVATIIRLKYIVDVGKLTPDDPNIMTVALRTTIWSNTELGMSIFAAGAATLMPFYNFVKGNVSTTRLRRSYMMQSMSRLSRLDRLGRNSQPVVPLDTLSREGKTMHNSNGSTDLIFDPYEVNRQRTESDPRPASRWDVAHDPPDVTPV